LWPIVVNSQIKNNLHIPEKSKGVPFSEAEKEEIRKSASEEFAGFKNLIGKSYTGVYLVDKESAE